MIETLIANQNMSEFTECDIQYPVKNVQHQKVLKIYFIHQSSLRVSLQTQPEWAVRAWQNCLCNPIIHQRGCSHCYRYCYSFNSSYGWLLTFIKQGSIYGTFCKLFIPHSKIIRKMTLTEFEITLTIA